MSEYYQRGLLATCSLLKVAVSEEWVNKRLSSVDWASVPTERLLAMKERGTARAQTIATRREQANDAAFDLGEKYRDHRQAGTMPADGGYDAFKALQAKKDFHQQRLNSQQNMREWLSDIVDNRATTGNAVAEQHVAARRAARAVETPRNVQGTLSNKLLWGTALAAPIAAAGAYHLYNRDKSPT